MPREKFKEYFKTNIYVIEEHDRWLRQTAHNLKISRAELVRKLIEEKLVQIEQAKTWGGLNAG